MPTIKLEMEIKAPIEVVFDLSRSINLHEISAKGTKEQAIAGRMLGLIELGESVTWRAKHFGIWQRLTSKITALEAPNYFVDEMLHGAFKSFKHEHFFTKTISGTILSDVFTYTSPYGILGTIADHLFLMRYMKRFLYKRNLVIKTYAESGMWKDILSF